MRGFAKTDYSDTLLAGDALARATSVDDLRAAIGRRVSRYTPNPLPAGAIYLQPTEERRHSGSHYTPRSLTEPIVRTTLRPIFERLGHQATPEQILDLKVCDPAMGSGAFLVEACRLLAERLVRAWEVHKCIPKVPADEDLLTYARRLVAERCLYGVDKNPFAVDLAKLSLWLATLARDHPFTFLNHALRHGDSLVGLTREQIACFHWQTSEQLPLLRNLIDARVSEARSLREQIEQMDASDDVLLKARLLREADDALADVRLIGDLVIAAFFGREKAKDREALRTAYAGKVELWLLASGRGGPLGPPADETPSSGRGGPLVGPPEDILALLSDLREGEHPVTAFHWEIEFPEVLNRDNLGFDAFVGNPPFMGGSKISSNLGTPYRDYLLQTHTEAHGNGDLVAHFYRRAFNMLRGGGTFGLIATNTIAQGDTRGTGLRWLRKHGGTIFAARKRVKWPGGAAAVIVSVVHVARGSVSGPSDLDGRPVERITAFLFHMGADDDPVGLKANENRCFKGSVVLGRGFTFDDTDKSGLANSLSLMHDLIRKDPRNAERIHPYIGGEEVNDRPTHAHHRYVINFGQIPLRRERLGGSWAAADERVRHSWLRAGIVPLDFADPVAADWPDLLAIVEQKVKPARLAQNREGRARYWWRYGEVAPGLYHALLGLDRVLVRSLTSKYFPVFTYLPCPHVYDQTLIVFATRGYRSVAVLCSRIHEEWCLFLGATLEGRPRYDIDSCFEPFPFPCEWESDPALERVGREYYDFRAAVMVRNNEGLTKTYNRFHDPQEQGPDIVKLRELHDAVDRAVLDAYDWTNIQPRCEFILDYEDEEEETPGKPSKRRKPWRYRWPDDIRDEVLARLLELNRQRAEEERARTGAKQTRAKEPVAKRTRNRGQRAVPLLESVG